MVGEALEHLGGAVRGVDAHPGPRGVGAGAPHGDVGAQHTLAAGLDARVGRLHQDREAGVEQQLGAFGGDAVQPVAVALDLLALVEDVGEVAGRCGERRRQPQGDRDTALHVAGAESVQPLAVEPGGQVVRDGHGVQVPGEDHPLGAAERRAGDDGVADPLHAQVGQGAQGGFDGVREGALLAALGGEVDEGAGQRDGVGGEVERYGEPGGHDWCSFARSWERARAFVPFSAECFIPYSA